MRVETDGDSGPQLGAADVDIYCLGIIVSALSQTQDQGPGPGNQITAVAPCHGVPGIADYPADQVTIQLCISIFNIDCQHLLHNDVVELDTTTDMYVSCDNKCDYYVNIYLYIYIQQEPLLYIQHVVLCVPGSHRCVDTLTGCLEFGYYLFVNKPLSPSGTAAMPTLILRKKKQCV